MHRTARLRSFIQRRSFSPPGLYCHQHPPKYRPQHILAGTINGDFKNCSHRQFGWTTSWSTVRLFSSTIDGRLSSDDLNKVLLEICVHKLLQKITMLTLHSFYNHLPRIANCTFIQFGRDRRSPTAIAPIAKRCTC